jgi:hypothetical protein
MYRTVWGEAATCDKITSDLAHLGWRIISFEFVGMNEVETLISPDGPLTIVHVPCFSYLLEHAEKIAQAQAGASDKPPERKFLGMGRNLAVT